MFTYLSAILRTNLASAIELELNSDNKRTVTSFTHKLRSYTSIYNISLVKDKYQVKAYSIQRNQDASNSIIS